MIDIVLDRAAIVQLLEGKNYLRIRNADGQMLGFFLPDNHNTSQLLLNLEPPITPEELKRRSSEPAGETLAEFWEKMRRKHPDKFD